MPTSEFEKKIHRWASLICCFVSYRCLVRVGSICNLLELDLQMPGRGRKHLQLAGIGFADAWSGLEASATCWNWICRCLVRIGSICNLLVLELQMPGRGWKHPQLAGYEFADAYHQVDIKNPTTIEVGLFFYVEKRAKCSRGLAEHIVLKYNKASHFFLFFTGNCILLSSAVRS